MFKIVFSIVLILTSYSASAQFLTKKDYPLVFAATDSVLEAFIRLSKFETETNEETGKKQLTPKSIEDFKSLFLPGAEIDDEIAPKYLNDPQVKGCKEYLQVQRRPVDDYLRVRQNYFQDGISVKVNASAIDYSEISSGNVFVVVDKSNIARYKPNDSDYSFYIESRTIVSLTLIFDIKTGKMKIKDILLVVKEPEDKIPGYKHREDYDQDFVRDDKDQERRIAGLASADGMPNPEELRCMNITQKKNAIEFTPIYGFVGFGNLLANQGLNYDFVGNYNETNRPIQNIRLSLSSLGGQLLFTRYFDRRSRIGLSAGLRFNYYWGNVQSDSVQFTYKGTDNQSLSNGFQRTIRSNGALNEDITSTAISVPILIRYKKKLNVFAQRLSVEVSAGPLLSLSYSGTSDFSGNQFDYEGQYMFNLDPGLTPVPKSTGYSPTSDYILDLSSSFYRALGFSSENITSILNEYNNKGYDVGLNVFADNEDKTAKSFRFRPSILVGILVQLNLSFKVSQKINILAGGFFSSIKMTNAKTVNNYVISSSRGSYNTLMNSIGEITQNEYGINLGFKIDF